MSPLDHSSATDALHDRRAAIAALGADLRALVEAAVRTGAPDEVLLLAAKEAQRLTALLTVRPRGRAELPDVDVFPGGIRRYSPVTGAGSPLAPPMRMESGPDGSMVGTCTLGVAHEGPPGYGHGGVSALLLDEVMGWACTAAGPPGMTVDLKLQYRRPVVLETPLRVTARVTGRHVRKNLVHGTIATAAAPQTILVEAEAVFFAPAPDQARALFPSLQDPA
ncbi:PaaI family thioesterase [Streptosporangium roseum]|uniref:PaaI family thioesterase n=1 Tax=Streptosporangium roseum TaxID=2001 RepID=UPI00332477F1